MKTYTFNVTVYKNNNVLYKGKREVNTMTEAVAREKLNHLLLEEFKTMDYVVAELYADLSADKNEQFVIAPEWEQRTNERATLIVGYTDYDTDKEMDIAYRTNKTAYLKGVTDAIKAMQNKLKLHIDITKSFAKQPNINLDALAAQEGLLNLLQQELTTLKPLE